MSWRSVRSTQGGLSAPLAFLLGLLCVFACSNSPAQAAKMYFGTQEYLNFIQDVAIKGPNGEALYLGYKYSFYSFVLPYSLSDDGYILGVKGRDVYLRLDRASIEKFQKTGLLPSPLPTYQLSALDYAMGHIIWAMPVIIAGAVAITWRGRRRRQRAMPYFGSALRHGHNGDVDEAIADYTRAIEIDPKFESALINRGVIYDRRGDYDQAIADFTKAVKIGPKPVIVLAFINRGLAHQKKGAFDRAIADYSHAIELSKAPAAYLGRGKAFADSGDYESAITDYSKVIELEPNSAVTYQARGSAYEAQGDASRAQADHNMAIEIASRRNFAATY